MLLLVVICVVLLLLVLVYVLFVFVLFYVLFACKCVLYHCHRVLTQLQLTNISYHISQIDLCLKSCKNLKQETFCLTRKQNVSYRL